MKHRLIWFEEGASPTDLKATVVVASDDRATVEKFIKRGKTCPAPDILLFAPAPPRRGPLGRKVVVVAVDEEKMEDLPPSSWPVERSFDNAAEASRAMGLKYNQVAMGLAALKSKPASERRVTVKGVTFQYADDAQEAKLEDLHD